MMMKRFSGEKTVMPWMRIGVLSLVLWACGEDPQQLFETAQFEEQQQNRAHAQELYERIVRDHPATEVAKKAQERLEEWKKEKP